MQRSCLLQRRPRHRVLQRGVHRGGRTDAVRFPVVAGGPGACLGVPAVCSLSPGRAGLLRHGASSRYACANTRSYPVLTRGVLDARPWRQSLDALRTIA